MATRYKIVIKDYQSVNGALISVSSIRLLNKCTATAINTLFELGQPTGSVAWTGLHLDTSGLSNKEVEQMKTSFFTRLRSFKSTSRSKHFPFVSVKPLEKLKIHQQSNLATFDLNGLFEYYILHVRCVSSALTILMIVCLQLSDRFKTKWNHDWRSAVSQHVQKSKYWFGKSSFQS